LDYEEEERRPPHAPGVGQRDALLADAHGVEVEEEVGQHHHHAIPPVGRHRVAEDALPHLGLGDLVQDRHKRLVNSERDRYWKMNRRVRAAGWPMSPTSSPRGRIGYRRPAGWRGELSSRGPPAGKELHRDKAVRVGPLAELLLELLALVHED